MFHGQDVVYQDLGEEMLQHAFQGIGRTGHRTPEDKYTEIRTAPTRTGQDRTDINR